MAAVRALYAAKGIAQDRRMGGRNPLHHLRAGRHGCPEGHLLTDMLTGSRRRAFLSEFARAALSCDAEQFARFRLPPAFFSGRCRAGRTSSPKRSTSLLKGETRRYSWDRRILAVRSYP